MTTDTATAPIHKTVEVACSVDHAFAVFTERIMDWWPVESHSLQGKDVEAVVVEPRAGGEMYERTADGRREHWAKVLAWEPPHRLVLAWHVNAEDIAETEIEVRFVAEGDQRTRVELEHRNWELLGEVRGAEARAGYHEGWDFVLSRYPAAAAA
jgi:uncharacterized protein YndB with AHSA1/START domain